MNAPQHYHHTCLVFIRIILVTSLLLAGCGDRQKTYTIGIINLTSGLDPIVDGFKKSMTEFGYTEDESIAYIYEGATSSIDTLDAVAQKLVESEVDLILSLTTPASQAAQRATAGTGIPVVFVPVTDPVGAGLVKSLKRPNGNMTGVTFGFQEGPRLQWLLRIAPAIEEIYIPYTPEDRSAVLALEIARATASELGIRLITRRISSPEEVTIAIQEIPEDADAIFLLPDSLMGMHLIELIEAANARKLPTSGPNNRVVQYGILTGYGILEEAVAKQAARLTHQILSGIEPSDLPVEAAGSSLIMNLKTAEIIGLDIPDEILLQADVVIH